MKLKTVLLAALAIIMAESVLWSADTVTATPDKPITSGTWVTVGTNDSGPFLSGTLVDLVGDLSAATNLSAAVFGIESGGHYGGGALLLYNVTKSVATGIGVDYLHKSNDKQVTMPSCQFQFQTDITIASKVTLRPFVFTGVATPISGKGSDNGSAVGLFGAGTGITIYKNLAAFYALEDRTGEPKPWNIFGLSCAF